MAMNYVNTVLVSDINIANEQAKRIQNSLRMRAKTFLKEHEIIDKNEYFMFRIHNKDSNSTYTVELEKPIGDNKPKRVWASCNCPDFMQRISNEAWNIPCKHGYRALFSLKQETYIDLVNRRISMPSKTKTVKIDYLDQACPKCNQRAVVPYSKLSCIFCKPIKNAKYVCENCYYAW